MFGSRFNEICPQLLLTSGLTSPPRALSEELPVLFKVKEMKFNKIFNEFGYRPLIECRVNKSDPEVNMKVRDSRFLQLCVSLFKFLGISVEPPGK